MLNVLKLFQHYSQFKYREQKRGSKRNYYEMIKKKKEIIFFSFY